MNKKKEVITLSVHRSRFVDYLPSAITSLAFPPLPLPSIKRKKTTTTTDAAATPEIHIYRFGLLAVGHANGNIDICEWAGNGDTVQCPQAWAIRKTLFGPYPSKVDSLALVLRFPDDLKPGDVPNASQLRLFSSGGGTELVEWDIDRGCIRRTISSQGGSIWSIAANPSCTSLALGCEDGTVRILSVANDMLTHSRRFDRVNCRILSMAWGPPVPRSTPAKKTTSSMEDGDGDSDSDEDEDEDEWIDSWLVTGGSDTSLRKWDVASGRVLDRMGVGKVRGERTLVWTVGVLGDGTIVSGDSLGMVKFWDSKTCTQLYSFQAHGADVLCMAIGPDGKSIYTSGVDQKTMQFSFIKIASASTTVPTTQWTQSSSKRMHSHDVRALAIWPPYTPLPASYQHRFPLNVAPVLASGGLDMSVVLTPVAPPRSTAVKVTNPLDTSVEATFEDSYHRKMGYTVAGHIRVARSTRLVSCAKEAELSMWKILKKGGSVENEMNLDAADDGDGGGDSLPGGWEHVLEMELNVHSNIVSHDISDNGRWLAVSDLYETKLFSLISKENGQIAVKRVKEFVSILRPHIPASSSSSPSYPESTGSSCIRFTPDSSKLILTTVLSSYVLVIDLTGEKPRVLRRFEHHRLNDLSVNGRAVLPKPEPSTSTRKGGKKNKMKNRVNGDAAEKISSDSLVGDVEDEDGGGRKDGALIGNVDRIAVSVDGQWLATSDSRARLHIFNLDSVSHHTTLPTFPKPAQCLSFDPMHPSVLLLAFADNTIQIYDVETRQFPVWGKDLASFLSRKLAFMHEVVLGVEFEPFQSEGGKTRYVLFWGSTWIFKASLETFVRSSWKSRKRRREAEKAGGRGREDEEEEEEGQWRNTKMITQYRPILCCDFLNKEELVVVERPLVDVLMTLPPAYFKHKYGTS